jgi:DNA-binding MarR family transcriptional regulator
VQCRLGNLERLVIRVESTEDRRVRIIALTPRRKNLIVSAYKRHSGQIRRVFSELSSEELRCLEVALKKVGKRASALNASGAIRDGSGGRP